MLSSEHHQAHVQDSNSDEQRKQQIIPKQANWQDDDFSEIAQEGYDKVNMNNRSNVFLIEDANSERYQSSTSVAGALLGTSEQALVSPHQVKFVQKTVNSGRMQRSQLNSHRRPKPSASKVTFDAGASSIREEFDEDESGSNSLQDSPPH